MHNALSADELGALTAAQKRARRADAELRAAQADLDLLLLNLQEAYAIGPGDRLAPDGTIIRAREVSA